MLILKRWYIGFLDKDKKNSLERIIYLVLYIFSFLYGAVVSLRNYLYDRGVLRSVDTGTKVISVGNISWGGSGKTSLVMYLHKKLSKKYRVASITKGYARDEFMLLKKEVKSVFDSKDRIGIIKKFSSRFDVFILDDGFQYRKLKRNLDIVTMGDKELRSRIALIPGGIFREPLGSLKRADIVVITYWHRIKNIKHIIHQLHKINPQLKVYLGEYNFRELLDRTLQPSDLGELKKRKTAVLTAIGYPEGFIDVLAEVGITPRERLIYPDHYQFASADITRIENYLVERGIEDVIITYKDFYHIDFTSASLRYFILKVEMSVMEEEKFLQDVEKILMR